MSRRAAGVFFLFIGAFLYGIKYLSASIYGASAGNPSEKWFNQTLNAIGDNITTISIIFVVVGIIYLAWAETIDLKNKTKD